MTSSETNEYDKPEYFVKNQKANLWQRIPPIFLKDNKHSDIFLCSHCKCIPLTPYFSLCKLQNNKSESHIYCHECIPLDKCDICKSVLPKDVKEYYTNSTIEFTIKNLDVICKCGWNGKISDIVPHLENNCTYYLTWCKNIGHGCNEYILPTKMAQHLENCMYRKHACRFCNTSFYWKYYQEHLDNDCKKVPTICKYCEEKIEKGLIFEHYINQCKKIISPCDFEKFGCKFKGNRLEIEEHFKKHTMPHVNDINNYIRVRQYENINKTRASTTFALIQLNYFERLWTYFVINGDKFKISLKRINNDKKSDYGIFIFNCGTIDKFVKWKLNIISRDSRNEPYKTTIHNHILPQDEGQGYGVSLEMNDLKVTTDAPFIRNHGKILVHIDDFIATSLISFQLFPSTRTNNVLSYKREIKFNGIPCLFVLAQEENNWSIKFYNNDTVTQFIKFELVIYNNSMEEVYTTTTKREFSPFCKKNNTSNNITQIDYVKIFPASPLINDGKLIVGIRNFEVW